MPDTAIAFISIRASIKFKGLINVSGFHVDPGFRGQLRFAVYNAGSSEIDLDQDERVFMIWFADLDACLARSISTDAGDDKASSRRGRGSPSRRSCISG